MSCTAITPWVPKGTARGILPAHFTSLVVAVLLCKKKGNEDGLTLLDLITFLQTLVSFPPLKAVGTGQVAIVKKDYRTGQIAVP